MLKKSYITFFLLLMILQSYGHGEDLSRISIQIPLTYDLKNYRNNIGLEGNFNYQFFNGGVEYRYAINKDQNNNVLNLFLGAGILYSVQIQLGYSTNNYALIRLRTEWRLSDFGLDTKKKSFIENISIKASIDRTIFTTKHDWFFSVGLGYSWNLF